MPPPWNWVAIVIMQYISLNESRNVVKSFHVAVLNHFQGNQPMDIPTFLFNSLVKTIEAMQKGMFSSPRHARLPTFLFNNTTTNEPSLRIRLGLIYRSNKSKVSKSLNSKSVYPNSQSAKKQRPQPSQSRKKSPQKGAHLATIQNLIEHAGG